MQKTAKGRRVAITGMGIVSALGNSPAEAWARLGKFENLVTHCAELEQYKGMRAHLASRFSFVRPAAWTRKTTRTMGDVSLYALASAEQAIAQAGLDAALLQSGRTGVAYGSCSGSVPPLLDFNAMIQTKEVVNITSGTYIKLMPQTAACNLSIHFGTRGRLVPTGTACTSGSLALGSAAELIRYGLQDVMIAGGGEEFSPTQVAVFDTLFATSTRNDAPHTTPAPYDAQRDGLVIGEGAATFVLEEWEHARRRGAEILAEVVGFCENTDGTHPTNPNPETMAGALRGALEDAALPPSAIGYVNGHGTATRAGDAAETAATFDVFRRAVPISSTKSYIGHTLGACGAIEALVTVEALRHGWYPPTLNLHNPADDCAPLDYIMGEGRKMDCAYAMSNNFAFGGVNTSLIFARAD